MRRLRLSAVTRTTASAVDGGSADGADCLSFAGSFVASCGSALAGAGNARCAGDEASGGDGTSCDRADTVGGVGELVRLPLSSGGGVGEVVRLPPPSAIW